MNTAELEILQSKTLSHLSRSLYAFFLRPNAEKNILKLDTMAAAYYLSSSSSCFPTQASLDTVLKCLDELSAHKLVSYTQDAATGEYSVRLPLFMKEMRDLPALPFQMHLEWRPGPGFSQAALLCGLADSTFSGSDLCSFISYWISKPEKRNQSAWERAFAQRLSRKRSVSGRAFRNAAVPDKTASYVPYAQSADIKQAETPRALENNSPAADDDDEDDLC